MGVDKDAGTKLISDIVFLTQRANDDTCGVVARTVERLTSRYLDYHPSDIKNAKAYQAASSNLCECIRSLRHIATGTGEEIIAKRRALDMLLALSNEIKYLPSGKASYKTESTVNLVRSA